MRIRRLEKSLINKIAAGEVVVRPASAVKELMENSIDAEAKRVVVEISNKCRNIKVTDDGIGMSEEEALLALERYTTSKIADYEDIKQLSTRGFRGEALTSVAAVSRLELISRPADSLSAEYLSLEGGNLIEKGQRASPPGTSITVKDLFFNTPARLKFLKSLTTELNHVIQVATRQALSLPHIGFLLTNEGKRVFDLPWQQTLKDRFVQLLGSSLAGNCLPVNLAVNGVKIWGYLVKPEVSRKDRSQQFFFVNSRPISCRSLTYALEDGFKGFLMTQRYPIAAIFIQIDPSEVDVNVHPSKDEVRFKEERKIAGLVYRAVLETLRGAQLIKEIKLAPMPEEKPTEPTASKIPSFFLSPEELLKRQMQKGKLEKPGRQIDLEFQQWQEPGIYDKAGAQLLPGVGQESIEITRPEPIPAIDEASIWRQDYQARALAQIADTYIVADYGENLLLIDQHAAHERLVYLKLKAQAKSPKIQTLLIPITLEISAADLPIMEMLIEHFKGLGIEVEHFGGNSYQVRAVPADVGDIDWILLINDLLSDFSQMRKTTEVEEVQDRILTRLACHSAIRAGQKLQLPEMQRLIDELRRAELSFTCPHGRPTLILLTRDQLDRYFKRK